MPDTKDQLDTGTGGFDVGDGTERARSFDVGVSDADGEKLGPFNRGNINVDKEQRDISAPTRRTLASYLSKQTIKNYYPVDPPATVPQLTKLEDESGYVPPLSTDDSGNVTRFARASDLRDNTQGVQGQTEALTQLNIVKGHEKPKPNAVNGNDLLIGAGLATSRIGVYTNALLKNNRFNSDEPASNGSNITKSQRRYKKTPSSFGQYENQFVPPEEIDFGQMAQVGSVLTLRAGLEMGSRNEGYDPGGTGTELKALLPGLAQLSIQRIDADSLTAADVLDAGDVGDVHYISPMSDSWGSLNNVLDQYTGITALGMMALSAVLVFAVELLIKGLSILFSLGGGTNGKAPSKDKQGRYALGAHVYSPQPSGLDKIFWLLGLQPTNANFSAALKTGVSQFFNGDGSEGFKVVTCRTIIRSGVMIIDAIKNIGGNPISIAKGIVGMIDILKRSKLIMSCNVFAQLGDAELTRSSFSVDQDAIAGVKVSSMDATPNTNAVRKSRLKNSLKLAWSGNRAPGALLLPPSIYNFVLSKNSLNVGRYGMPRADGNTTKLKLLNNGNNNRLSAADVKKIEASLDIEYVPFYFHDLRTNEIVGFHAFLESLSDAFTPTYDSTDAFGRVDSIMTYKNTKRKISFSFLIASTSENDFDDMWIKINKLVTLVYPQYTQGRSIQNNDKSYVMRMPFSQVISSSPMIRLRIGDVIRGNYSKFNLARLFGIGDQDSVINAKPLDFKSSTPDGFSEFVNKSRQTVNPNFWFNADYSTSHPHVDERSLLTIGSGDTPEFASHLNFINLWNVPNELIALTVDKVDGSDLICKVDWTDDDDIRALHAESLSDYEALIGSGAPRGCKIIGGKYRFSLGDDMWPTNKTHAILLKQFATANPSTYLAAVDDFMRDDDPAQGNAIARSFKSVEGKGLAGFIDSLSFDWLDKTTWEISPGKTAPKMCKVTVSFTPIHDIPPGIAYDGFNRAPVYPVGSMGPRK